MFNLIFSLIISACTPTATVGQIGSQPQTGVVEGTLFGPYEAVIPRFELVFTSGEIVRRITSRWDGTYSVELPAGKYTVTAPSQIGFLPYRRAPLHVLAGGLRVLNIWPAESGAPTCILSVEPGNLLREEQPVVSKRYDLLSLSGTASKEPEILIEYEEKHTEGKLTIFKRATVSCDAKLLYADELNLDQTTFELWLYGNVLVDDGAARHPATFAYARLRDETLEVLSVWPTSH